jgi:DNA-binding MarR family transcriptional regulator
MEPTTFTALKAMEKRGYITRRQKGENRKNVYIQLTARGRALKAKLVPLAEAVNHAAVAGVAPAHVKRTREVLLAIIENLARESR